MNKKIQNLLLVIGSLLIAELCLYTFGKIYLKQSLANRKIYLKSNKIRILTIGESTTALGGNHSYPRLLEKELNKDGNNFKVINVAVPGYYLNEMVSELPKKLRVYKPHLIITMAGINDLLLGTPYEEPSFFSIYKPKVYKLIEYIYINFFKSDTLKEKYKDQSKFAFKEDTLLKKELKKLENELIFSINKQELIKSYLEFLKKDKLYTISPVKFYKYSINLALKICPADNSLCEKMMKAFDKWNLTILKTKPKYFKQKFYIEDILNIYGVSEFKDTTFLNSLKSFFDKSILNSREFIIFKINNFYCKRDSSCNDQDKNYISYLYSNNRFIVKKLREIINIAKVSQSELIISGYATLNIDDLKTNIDSSYPIYNSLEKPFQEALMNNKYEDLFTDNFAIEFGHATKKGNKIIASKLSKLIKEKLKR